MYREYLENKARVQGYKVYTKLSSPLLHVDNSNVRLSYLNTPPQSVLGLKHMIVSLPLSQSDVMYLFHNGDIRRRTYGIPSFNVSTSVGIVAMCEAQRIINLCHCH